MSLRDSQVLRVLNIPVATQWKITELEKHQACFGNLCDEDDAQSNGQRAQGDADYVFWTWSLAAVVQTSQKQCLCPSHSQSLCLLG